ncbi:rCG59043, partial [Rattus norvegicus]
MSDRVGCLPLAVTNQHLLGWRTGMLTRDGVPVCSSQPKMSLLTQNANKILQKAGR